MKLITKNTFEETMELHGVDCESDLYQSMYGHYMESDNTLDYIPVFNITEDDCVEHGAEQIGQYEEDTNQDAFELHGSAGDVTESYLKDFIGESTLDSKLYNHIYDLALESLPFMIDYRYAR